jgi:hypothetical protein
MAEHIWLVLPSPPATWTRSESAGPLGFDAVGFDAEKVFRAHADLALAYSDMGLLSDALREAAIALHETAPRAIVHRVLAWMFDPVRARPDALAALRAAMMGR